MKAIAHLKHPIAVQDRQLILNTINTTIDIKVMDLNVESGELLFQYQNSLILDLLERRLLKIGYPIISYSYPDRRPSHFRGSDADEGSLA